MKLLKKDAPTDGEVMRANRPRIAIEADAQTLAAALHDGCLWRYPEGFRSNSWLASHDTIKRLLDKGYLWRWQATNEQLESVVLMPAGFVALTDYMKRRRAEQAERPVPGQHRQWRQ